MPEKKAIENKTVLSQKRYETINQKSLELTAIIDSDWNFNFISPNCKKITGFKEEEITTKSIFGFIHPEDINLVKIEFEKIISYEEQNCITYRFKTKNNTWIWLNCIGFTIPYDLCDGLWNDYFLKKK